jgi:hypothetical protein
LAPDWKVLTFFAESPNAAFADLDLRSGSKPRAFPWLVFDLSEPEVMPNMVSRVPPLGLDLRSSQKSTLTRSSPCALSSFAHIIVDKSQGTESWPHKWTIRAPEALALSSYAAIISRTHSISPVMSEYPQPAVTQASTNLVPYREKGPAHVATAAVCLHIASSAASSDPSATTTPGDPFRLPYIT